MADSSSTPACSMASSEPKAEAIRRAVGGPRRRIDKATSTRHRSACRALSISSNILRVFSPGRTYTGTSAVPLRVVFRSTRTTTASAGTSYPGYGSVAASAGAPAAACRRAESFFAGVGAVQNAGT